MNGRSTILAFIALMFAILAGSFQVSGQTRTIRFTGTVLDPTGRPVAGAAIDVVCGTAVALRGSTESDGTFMIPLTSWGSCTVRVVAAGFNAVTHKIELSAPGSGLTANLTLRLEQVSPVAEEVVVNGDVSEIAIDAPDPSQKVLVREQLLDANPGRPGAPISIPGLPIETASGGIKAPQYFAPGVMADHGEPIAQYISVGGYLVTNNLSANAHGNGYSDPNIYVSGALAGVNTDGGAFNVLEGNHSLNLAATYMPRQLMQRYITLTGDYRDIDMTAGWAPANPNKRWWVALESNYGNGLVKDLEHRKMEKLNAQRIIEASKHEITLYGILYYGVSREGNVVPIGCGQDVNDTLDERQRDQTHTVLLAADDHWKLGSRDAVTFSGFFRTYNLALFSNFGEGLIRQSEYRFVEGAEMRETHDFAASPKGMGLEGMAGLDYHEDDIRNDDLDHYGGGVGSASGGLKLYGPFTKVLASDLTIRDLAPYAAVHGDLGKHVRFYLGLRPDTIELINDNKMASTDSFDIVRTFVAPKATLAWTPGAGSMRWLPSASLSLGQAFFTQDPRISFAGTTGQAPRPSPLERSHSLQLVLEKEFPATDVRITMAHTTTTEQTGKIDPDSGTPFDLGPGRLNFLTASARHQFGSWGSVQAVFSKANAEVLNEWSSDPGWTANSGWNPTVECPRTMFDFLTTLDKLPLGMQFRGEYEYIGHKVLDAANAQDGWKQLESIPVGETRLALVHTCLNGRLEVGANSMIARGYTGQTTETIASLATNPNQPWRVGDGIPYCLAGSGPSGAGSGFDCGGNVYGTPDGAGGLFGTDGKQYGIEWPVGIRMVSFVGASISWHLHQEK